MTARNLKPNITKGLGVPTIAPVSKGIHRPLWSVMIPTYNCAKYLERTLKSVLEQAPSPELMQIEVVDDCSTKDDPEAIVRKLGRGRVSFYRQPHNVGPMWNFNTCIERSTGQIVHILHGDDLVLPGFYNLMQEAFDTQPTIGAAFCRYIPIDEEERHLSLSGLESCKSGVIAKSALESRKSGVLANFLECIAVASIIQTPTVVVKRSVYEELGGFHLELFHAGDWEMWKRIATHYQFWYEPQPLACYRMHSSSHTSSLIRSGANVANVRRAIEISKLYLPNKFAGKLTHKAREACALSAFEAAFRQLIKLDTTAAIAQAREGLKCSPSLGVIKPLVSFIIRGGVNKSWRPLSKALHSSSITRKLIGSRVLES